MEFEDYEYVDGSLLINEVKQHPEIWDYGSEAYKDRGKRQSAWEEIFANLYQDSSQKSENEKNALIKKLSLRWKHLRDNYARTIRGGCRARPRRRYIYARQLSFLYESKTLSESMPSNGRSTPSSSSETDRSISRHGNEYKSSLLNINNSPIVDTQDGEDDICLLINEVKKYREIWDIRSEAYKDRAKRQLAWEKIYASLFQDCTQKSEDEKNVIIKKLLLKWKHMRDAYAASIRKGNVSSHTPKRKPRKQYIYATQLSFLQETMAFSVRVTSSLRPANMSSEVNGIAYRHRHEPKSSNFMNTPTALQPPDADRSFFESLIPIVKQFSEDQKLEFWGSVIQLAQEIKRKSSKPLDESHLKPTETLFIPTKNFTGINSEDEMIPEIKPNLHFMHPL